MLPNYTSMLYIYYYAKLLYYTRIIYKYMLYKYILYKYMLAYTSTLYKYAMQKYYTLYYNYYYIVIVLVTLLLLQYCISNSTMFERTNLFMLIEFCFDLCFVYCSYVTLINTDFYYLYIF